MVNSVPEIARLIAKRDGISYEAAMRVINCCRDEILNEEEIDYDAAVDSIAYWLGLEPDYLEILLSY